MKLRRHCLLLAALASLAGLPAPAAEFNLDTVTDAVAPSSRGAANTTWFGWEVFETPGAIDDTTPDIGTTDPLDTRIVTTNGEDHRNGDGTALVIPSDSTAPYGLYEKITVKTSGTVHATNGRTTIIAQFVSPSGDFPANSITFSTINGILPTVVRGTNAVGKGQIWVKWVLAGNAATYDFTVTGSAGVSGSYFDRIVVDTHFAASAALAQPDIASANVPTFRMDQVSNVVAPTGRGVAANSTYFGWETFNEVADIAVPINDSIPDLGTNPGGVNFQTTNAQVHISSTRNLYVGSGTLSEQVTVTTDGTPGSGFTTIIAQAVTAFGGFPDTITFSNIAGVAPTVVQTNNSIGSGQVWAKWKIPGNATNYTFTVTGPANVSGFSMTRFVVDTFWSATGYQTDVMRGATPNNTFVMAKALDTFIPASRGNSNTTWFGWENFNQEITPERIYDSAPDINSAGAPSGVLFRTIIDEDHVLSSGNLYISNGTLSEEVTVVTSGTVGSTGTTTIVAQVVSAFPSFLVTPTFSAINGVTPEVVVGKNYNGLAQLWVKWNIPGNQSQYTFNITAPPLNNDPANAYSFDRVVIDTSWRATGTQGDVAVADAAPIAHAMNQSNAAVVPSSRGINTSTYFGWEVLNDRTTRTPAPSVPANDSTPDIGTTTAGANFQTTNSEIHLLPSGNMYFFSGTLAEQITIPTRGTVHATNGSTTIMLQILAATSGPPAGPFGFADLITLGSINGVAPQIVQGTNATGGGHLWAKWQVPGNAASYTIPISGPANQAHFSIDRIIVDTAYNTANATYVGDTMSNAEIAVESPVATALVDGASTVDLGTSAIGANATKVVTIKNVGTTPLTSISATIDGANASEFSISVPPSPTLTGPTGTTSLTVRFAPTSAGIKNAVLHIASTDPNENPFDINLTGATPPSFAFSAPGYEVVENVVGGVLNVPVQRIGYTGSAVSVKVTLTPGTATAADYALISGTNFNAATGIVSFPIGVTSVNVPIEIEDDGIAEMNHTFTAKLSAPLVGGTLGTPNTVPVTIVDTTSAGDASVPNAPVVTTPALNTLVSVDGTGKVTITGTATDPQGVKSLQARFVTTPPATFTPATLGTPGGTTTSYTVLLTPPLGGTNTVEVTATNYADQSSAPVFRGFRVAVPLVVSVSGSGSVTTGYLGSTMREVAKSYTIKATPVTAVAPGHIFTGWTLGGVDTAAAGTPSFSNASPASLARLGIPAVALTKPDLTFIFRQGLILTANFTANPFWSLAGTYNGLIEASSSNWDVSANSTEGHFKGTVQNTGAFSGVLTIDGLTLNMAGAFDHTGAARFGTARATTLAVARTNKPSLKVSLNSTPTAPFKITGTVVQTSFQQSQVVAESIVEAKRAHYGSQILPGTYSAGSPTVTMASTKGLYEDDQVTGAGIPALARIDTIDSDTQITLTANATLPKTAASLTFKRELPTAYLATPAATSGTFTVVLPAKAPFYSRYGSFALDGTFTPADSDPNEFADGNVIEFFDDASLPDELKASIALGHTFTVTEKSGNTFKVNDQGLTPTNAGDDVVLTFAAAGAGEVMLESAPRQTMGYEREDYPQGYGFGTMTLTKTGTATLAGTLADGTPVSATTTISQPLAAGAGHDGSVAIFVPLYNKLGFVSGYVDLNYLASETDMDSPDLKWMRPSMTTSHYYPAGWPDVLKVGLQGAKFTYVAVNLAGTRSVLKAPDTAGDDYGDDIEQTLDDNGNAELTFGDGALTEDLSKLAFLSTKDVVTLVPDNDPTFTLLPVHTTGAFSGKFIHTDDNKIDYRGVFYQKGVNSGGYGYFLTVLPRPINYTGESGWVEILGEAP